MNLLKKILTILTALVMLAIGVLIALSNQTTVPLDLLIHTFEPRSLALWLLSAFAIGGVVGMLVSSLILLRTRATLSSHRRELEKARTELSRLRDNTPAPSTA
ncbi:MAG: LapA family protein [Pseudomonadota bacterium]